VTDIISNLVGGALRRLASFCCFVMVLQAQKQKMPVTINQYRIQGGQRVPDLRTTECHLPYRITLTQLNMH